MKPHTGIKVYVNGEWVQRVAYIENQGIKNEDIERLSADGLWVAVFEADYRLEKYDENGNLKLIVGKPKGEIWRKRRYLKSYELNNGYRKYGLNSGAEIVTGVVIENTAPYAEMVNRRYRVLQQSSARKGMTRWKKQYSKLVLVAARKEFKAAGLVK